MTFAESNRGTSTSVVRLLIGAVLMIAVIGIGIGFVRQQFGFYLILLFPALMGAAGGLLGRGLKAQTGNVVMGVLFGVVVGLLIYAVFRYADYYFFIQKLTNVLAVPTFAEYLELSAEVGLSIGRVTSSNRLPLEGQAVYIYWLVEIGIVAVTAIFAAIRNS